MTAWEVLSDTGQYFGRCDAATPESAFCLCMAVYGKQIDEHEVRTERVDEGLYRVTWDKTTYLVNDAHRPRPGQTTSPYVRYQTEGSRHRH